MSERTARDPAPPGRPDTAGLGVATTPLRVAGTPRGQLLGPVASALADMPELFANDREGLSLRDDGLDARRRSELLQRAAVRLRAAGLVPGWRDELCELLDERGAEIARFERGAFRTLGLQNRAVHVNGRMPDGRMWIARRSPLKLSSPNRLDNMAAGAIAAGETPADCAVRELWEEAGVSAVIAARTTFTDARLRSLRALRYGVHDEIILCADLELPDGFEPRCQDGEVAEFLCLAPQDVRRALTAGEFSVEAGLVVADWLARHPESC